MSWTNLKEVVDYLFCPDYWWIQRDQHNYSLDFIADLRVRYEKRLKKHNLLQRLLKEYQTKYKTRKKSSKKRTSKSSNGGLSSFIKAWNEWRLNRLQTQMHPARLLKEEKHINPLLTLADTSNESLNIFAESINVRWENNKLIVILDRSDKPLPGYQPIAFYSDLCLLSLHMYLVHVNFFTDKIEGLVKYSNYKEKKLYWRDKKTNKLNQRTAKLLSQAKKHIKAIQAGTKKNTSPLPFRCANCKFAQQQKCEKATSYPTLYIKNNKPEEDIKLTYMKFRHAAANLFNTSSNHWQRNAQELVNVMHSSYHIKQAIAKHCSSDTYYDIEEMVKTASIYKKELYNSYFTKKNEKVFGYQFLIYISEKGRRKLIHELIGAYGNIQGYDAQTSTDILIKNLIRKILGNLIDTIDYYLQSLLPIETAIHIQHTINIDNSQINLPTGNGIINAKMVINNDEDEEDA
jgi:hypothetical protein